ncbi:MAG: YD repeat-containing protein, partial [Betaproteobacteria bacterium]|nr:YD repeat-containing protein [Betaproteobacteria bacterium]
MRATDAQNNWRDLKYDANGNLLEQTLVLPANSAERLADHTSALYDLSDRKTLSLDAAGNATAYTYDPAGNVVRITNPDGYRVSLDYDELNRVVRSVGPQVTDPVYGLIRAVTRTTYDTAGNLTQVAAGRTDAG